MFIEYLKQMSLQASCHTNSFHLRGSDRCPSSLDGPSNGLRLIPNTKWTDVNRVLLVVIPTHWLWLAWYEWCPDLVYVVICSYAVIPHLQDRIIIWRRYFQAWGFLDKTAMTVLILRIPPQVWRHLYIETSWFNMYDWHCIKCHFGLCNSVGTLCVNISRTYAQDFLIPLPVAVELAN